MTDQLDSTNAQVTDAVTAETPMIGQPTVAGPPPVEPVADAVTEPVLVVPESAPSPVKLLA